MLRKLLAEDSLTFDAAVTGNGKHYPKIYPQKYSKCYKCLKKGHLAKKCHTQKSKSTNHIHVQDEEEEYTLSVYANSDGKSKAIDANG
ncbi:hypothetical protein DPMN_012348 [Dreissena polymorpha]|uniref:CCHC-type domain-containing protein n=1 Tax=Dreissena polymorpha TaxID=45954 RepID=A0A9D4S195_DREPO|nr:hypothetical protein DPMN_012348 [Dreissena polymorpha]